MAEERFPHLFLKAPPESSGFTSVSSGGGDPADFPDRDRQGHADHLERRLEQAWENAAGRQAAAHSTRRGCYLEFVSAPGAELALKSLESLTAGVRLLNVRTTGQGGNQITLATVFVPSDKRAHFLTKIRDYGDISKATPKGHPLNRPLVACIDDIFGAVLEDFWMDHIRPVPGIDPVWVEVWLSSTDEEAISGFRELLEGQGIPEHEDRPLLLFPERAVLLIFANGGQLASLIELSDLITELRAAREVATFFLDLENREQAEWCRNLVERLQFEGDGGVAVCILDEGVNRGHPLLGPLLAEEDLHSYDPDWGTSDHGGHGTLMAGLAGYGDLQAALESGGVVRLGHRLESAKILPPIGGNPQHLWGHVTAQGISRAQIEAPDRKRIVCLAVTARETRDAGHPTSWSAELDSLAAAVDGTRRRLIVVSAGNVNGNWKEYPAENVTNEVHDPAQAWNALSVGACTFKTRIESTKLEGYTPVAPSGGLSPFSTTSIVWDHDRWPIKPEIVMEGGNLAMSPDGETNDPEDLRLLSTSHDLTRAHFWPFEATSAASAQVAWMAARLQVAYPDAWPETLRGLIVHSASWTPALRDQFLSGAGKGGYRELLRACGYGVPDLERAMSCLKSSLTLVAQQGIQPFVIRDDGKKTRATNEMHLYRLPWPQDELLELGETNVRMRVTLSYFVEPGPGEVGWNHRYRYASHGLRFELNGPRESESEFVKRINKQARDEEEGKPDSEGPTDHWLLGQQRNVGSIHSDIWSGSAADLASSHLIAVRPVVGWWRERHHLGKVEESTRYSLIVSIETPAEEIDIYTPVAARIGISTPVPVEVSMF